MARDYAHWERFNLTSRLVFETRSWLIVARPHQLTLGSCNILLKRRVSTLSQTSPREFSNLRLAIARYERLVDAAFEPTKYNYVLSGQKDPEVHLHAVPRYDQSSARQFAGRQWIDSYWPYFPDFPRTLVPTDDWIVDEVTRKLRSVRKRGVRS